MNSRDAAYEEEQLRRAIEMSKKERGTASTGAATRKPKRSRSRSESEEYGSLTAPDPNMRKKLFLADIRLSLTDVMMRRRDSELLLQAHRPLPLKAKIDIRTGIRRMKSARRRKNPKAHAEQ